MAQQIWLCPVGREWAGIDWSSVVCLSGGKATAFSIAQSQTIGQQLDGGVRWFDLRVAFDPVTGAFHIYHVARGPTLEEVFSDLRAYLDDAAAQQAQELVVIKLSHFCAKRHDQVTGCLWSTIAEVPFPHAELHDMVEDWLGPYLHYGEVTPATAFGELVGGGPRIVVLYDDNAALDWQGIQRYRPHLPGCVGPCSTWRGVYDEYSETTDYDAMAGDQLWKLSQYGGDPTHLFLLSWTLTASTLYILNPFNSSLHELTIEPNRKLASALAPYAGRYQTNIVFVDFYQESKVIDVAIALSRGDEAADADRSPPVIAKPENVIAEATGPDGATVTFEVSATDDRDGPVPVTCTPPSGSTFPLGETSVECTASDQAGNTASEFFVVRVLDTTAPVLACPADVSAECSAHGGTPASDPQLAPFFEGVAATDAVDPEPMITNNAPTLIAVGTTMVTFTATDFSGNSSTCEAYVDVADTTPPTIDVVLNRDVLWPPNHKFAEIGATVTISDICDANPIFELTSIVCNEPESGLGDGGEGPDVVGADIGTSDVSFQLCSERSGRGDGRYYTINYTAIDECGNETSRMVGVRVPHDQSGGARASLGFQPDGASLNPESPKFAIVVYSEREGVEDVVDGMRDVDVADGDGAALSGEADALGFDASRIDVAHSYVGSLSGVLSPEQGFLQDLNGDGIEDLTLVYSVEDALALIENSSEDGATIGLHYTAGPGKDFLVSDIFALGTPVPFGLAVGDPGRGPGRGLGEVRPQVAGNASPGVDEGIGTPMITALTAVYPNPFSGTVTTAFELATGGPVRLAVYDARGTLVRSLANGDHFAGRYQVSWDGRGKSGRRVSIGLYFVRFETGAVKQTRKIILMD